VAINDDIEFGKAAGISILIVFVVNRPVIQDYQRLGARQTKPTEEVDLTINFKLTFATVVFFGAVPQIAHASCTGSACASFSVDGKNFSSSDKRAKATLVNKDQTKKIHVKGCITSDGKCGTGDSFELTIDPSKSAPISGPATEKFVVDVTSAEFVASPPPSLPSLTKTERGCSMNDVGPNGCPPKAASEWSQIKQKGDEANAALDAAKADLANLDPKDKAKRNDIMQRYSRALATIDFVETLFGKEKGPPAEHVDYVTNLKKKKEDVGKAIKERITKIFGCVPNITKSSVSCEGETDLGGGGRK
jgi:hypothetical protein